MIIFSNIKIHGPKRFFHQKQTKQTQTITPQLSNYSKHTTNELNQAHNDNETH